MAKNNGRKLIGYMITLSATDKKNLGTIRTTLSLQATEEEGLIWIKGFTYPGELPLQARQLPVLATYLIDTEGLLFPVGKITPVGKLKEFNWQPIEEFIEVELPVAAFSGKTNEKLRLELAESTKVEEGDAMLTSLDIWKSYVEKAPEARLKNLNYAVSENGEVLLCGKPLPAIPGKEYRIHGSILLPSGYDFKYPFLSGIVENEMNPERNFMLLFYSTGKINKIPLDALKPVTRSAVRLTI